MKHNLSSLLARSQISIINVVRDYFLTDLFLSDISDIFFYAWGV